MRFLILVMQTAKASMYYLNKPAQFYMNGINSTFCSKQTKHYVIGLHLKGTDKAHLTSGSDTILVFNLCHQTLNVAQF